jgi:hypothetical protein
MHARTIEQASDMLRAVLEQGQSFRQAAAPHGISRSTAERQVKALVRLAAMQTQIRSFRDADLGSLALLRTAREEVLQAVRRFDPAATVPARQTRSLGDLTEATRGVRCRSGNSNRDVALLLLVLSTGAKPLEIARLRVSDYVREDGSPRESSRGETPPGEGTFGRTLYFVNARLCKALDIYLEERRGRGQWTSGVTAYRGLVPESMLFLTREGRPFQVTSRSAGDARPRCPVLVAIFRSIFARAGMVGMTMQAARRQLAQRLQARGATDRQIGELLGIIHQRSVRRLLRQDAPSIERLLSDVI